MEPFFLRCVTCHARLRVRDERFLGQIQACPKCGSMVQIVAPAGWLAGGDSASEAPPELTEVAASSAPSSAASTVGWLRSHTVTCAIGATGIVAACGLAVLLALRGEEPLASRAPALPAVEVAPLASEKPTDEETLVEASEEAGMTVELSAADTAPVAGVAESDSKPALEPQAASVSVEEPSSSSFLPLITPPTMQVASNDQSVKPRTLTLEPVAPPESKPDSVTEASISAVAYPPEVETEPADESKSPENEANEAGQSQPEADQVALPALDPPLQRTNIKDQLAVPIESIHMPAMPIGDFVSFVSTMTAVPIELDAKVLGEVGLSSRSTVTVDGKATTVGKLLARVLKEHQLTCIQREGTLVVVRAKR